MLYFLYCQSNRPTVISDIPRSSNDVNLTIQYVLWFIAYFSEYVEAVHGLMFVFKNNGYLLLEFFLKLKKLIIHGCTSIDIHAVNISRLLLILLFRSRKPDASFRGARLPCCFGWWWKSVWDWNYNVRVSSRASDGQDLACVLWVWLCQWSVDHCCHANR